jgi:hypothetical protein
MEKHPEKIYGFSGKGISITILDVILLYFVLNFFFLCFLYSLINFIPALELI